MTAAAPLTPTPTGDVAATGDVTGLHLLHLPRHRLHPAAGPPLIPGPALTHVATDAPPAVAVTTIADMAAPVAPHHAATGPGLAPTAARPRRTHTPVADATGPAPGPIPGLPAVGACTGGLRAGLNASLPDPHPEATEAAQSPDRQDALSV